MAQGKKLSPDVRAAVIVDLLNRVSIEAIRVRHSIGLRAVTKIRAEAQITHRSPKRCRYDRHPSKDAGLIPALATLRGMSFAQRRGLQLRLWRAGNDPRRMVVA